MSEQEEPSAKIAKIEVSPKDQDEELDEGQEEWLSEGILTDDDYNTSADIDQNASNLNSSQDNTMTSMDIDSTNQTENIERTLNDFENSQTELPGDLGTFLIRKSDKKQNSNFADRHDSENEEHQNEFDDGNDTDELLRMLGDENQIKKKGNKTHIKTEDRIQESSDDDEYIFDGAKISRLKVARNAIMKKLPTRAVPEESDRDSDVSSDERMTVKRMFDVTKRGNNVASKSTAKGSVAAVKDIRKGKDIATKQRIQKEEIKPVEKNVPEIIDEEEYLDEEQFDLDEGLESDSEQRIMRPERMDEEVPTDGDSEPDDESLYDELPSSDSEDMMEWFTLDLRSERAGDYIPLLGPSARRLLSSERARAVARLSALKQSAAALNESSAGQAAALRRAARQLQELDAALRA